jgi:uncharacterized protein (DUF433 family)
MRVTRDLRAQRASRSGRVQEEPTLESLDRVTQQPEVMRGRACIRAMRVTVGMIVGMNGAGHSVEEVLADYPYLEREDIRQPCATPRGLLKNGKSCCRAHECACRPQLERQPRSQVVQTAT